jgi:hypothetical protein
VPVVPEVSVRKLALLTAVHEQLDAAVTASVPVDAAAPTLVCAAPSVTEHEPAVDDGDESLFEHAAAASATAIDMRAVSNRRGCLISRSF